MLLQVPGPRVDEGPERNPERDLPLATALSPPSGKFVATWKECSPGVADEVGDEDDESATDGDLGRFELAEANVSSREAENKTKAKRRCISIPRRSGT